ncbi:MAG: hypothetical protein AB7F35_04515 [Acetobacteraceae bacterium]
MTFKYVRDDHVVTISRAPPQAYFVCAIAYCQTNVSNDIFAGRCTLLMHTPQQSHAAIGDLQR